MAELSPALLALAQAIGADRASDVAEVRAALESVPSDAAVTEAQADAAAALAQVAAITPGGVPDAHTVPYRDDTNALRWGTSTEVVARALDWRIAGDYGIDTTGATTHSAAEVQAWLDSGVAYAAGTIKCSGPVIIKDSADLHLVTWIYTGGPGAAVQVGDGSVLFRKRILLPAVIAGAKTNLGWAQVADSVGVKILNANACAIDGTRIANFETGLLVRGEGAGCAYNAIRVAHLDNNKINQDISADATGWSNENSYFIGRFSFESAEGALVAGTRCIRIQTAASIPNNNAWFGGSVEGNTAEYHLECAGGENRFMQMRWENGAAGCRVWWRSGGFRNVIDRGYDAHKINETYEAGANPADVLTGQGWRIRQSAGTQGVLQLENASSSVYPAITIMAAGAAQAGTDPATGYACRLTANMLSLKRSTEAFDRIQLDAQNSRLYFGNGASALTRYIGNLGTSSLAVNGGNWCPGADATLDLGLSSFRWRDAHLSRGIGVHGSTPPTAKPSVTGSRGGNAALASLLTALASYGLITDGTTA